MEELLMHYDRILLYTLTMILGIFLFVLFQQHMIALDTSAWTFTGHVEAAMLLQITPYLFILTIIIVPLYFIMEEN
jgi:hypothetical protein